MDCIAVHGLIASLCYLSGCVPKFLCERTSGSRAGNRDSRTQNASIEGSFRVLQWILLYSVCLTTSSTTRGSKALLSLSSRDPPYTSHYLRAFSLERIVREASANKEYERIGKIVDQLCHDYAYAVHQPHARNGGLIGLAAASIALGSVSLFLLGWVSNEQV